MTSSVAASSQYIPLPQARGAVVICHWRGGSSVQPAVAYMARFGQAGEILADLVLKTGGVGPAVGDLCVLADLQRVGAGGDEDEGPDRLAVMNMVIACPVAGGRLDVETGRVGAQRQKPRMGSR